jgi:hypothetical protein
MSQKKVQLLNPLSGNINVAGVVTASSFVGGLTGDVTGDITGTASTAQGLTGTPNVVVGSVTAASGAFSGNVSVGGTLSYQDVEHIDSIGIITAQQGIQVLANGLDITGVSTFKSNVSIAEKIIHTGDTDTSFGFPGGDTFTVETGGSERLRVDSGGDVGIGTNNPGNALHVLKNGDGQTPVFFETTNGSQGELRFYNDSNGWSLDSGGNLRFVTGRTGNGAPTRFSIDSDGIAAFTNNVSIADTIFHTGDTGTKIRFPANNTVTVETNNTERLRVDSTTGRLLLNTASSIPSEPGEGHNPILQVAHVSGNVANLGISVSRFQASNPNSVPIILQKSRNSTIGSHTIVEDDDELGRIEFAGSDGSNFRTAAAISGSVDGTPGSSDMPGSLEFKTTADGATSPTERLRIDSRGSFQFSNGFMNETVKINTTARTGTQAVNLDDGMVHYFSTASAGTWKPNFTMSAGDDINATIATGDVFSPTMIVAKGATSHYATTIQVDGSDVTPEFSGGAPSDGGGSGTFDIYNYSIIKTGNDTFKAFAAVSTYE